MAYVAENDLELELWRKNDNVQGGKGSPKWFYTGLGATIAWGSKNAQLRVGLCNAL